MDREHTNRLDMPFVGIPTFLRTEYCKDLARLDAEVAVMGVPFDEGVPFMPGSRFGPRVDPRAFPQAHRQGPRDFTIYSARSSSWNMSW